MEESNSVPTKTPQNLQTSASKRPPLPLPPCHSRKRKANHVDTQNQTPHHFKIRALVKSLRPHFIQVLRTPDFRNSKAAHEIRITMNQVMDVYKQMAAEDASLEMSKKPSIGPSLPSENKVEQKFVDKNHEDKQGKHHHAERVPEKSPEVPLGVNSGFEKSESGRLQGTYVVGGSNFGWNFIMYPSSKAVYYGVTKESRRSQREKAQTPT